VEAVAVVFIAADGTEQVATFPEATRDEDVLMCGWGARGALRICEDGTHWPSERRTAPSPEWGMV